MGGSQSKPVPQKPQGPPPPVPYQDEANPNLMYSGQPCSFKDSGEFEYRMKEMQILNYIIRKMSKVLCMPASNIDFNRLIKDIMSFETPAGVASEGMDYALLSSDPIFKAPWEDDNRFMKLANYMQTNGGKTQEQMKADFEEMLVMFIRLREVLINYLVGGCKTK